MGGPTPWANVVFSYKIFVIKMSGRQTEPNVGEPKVVLEFMLGVVKTHLGDFGPPAIPWVAPHPGQMWFSHIRFLL